MARSAFEQLILELQRFLEPLEYYFRSPEGVMEFLSDLGWNWEDSVPDPAPILDLVVEVRELPIPEDWSEYIILLRKVLDVTNDIRTLSINQSTSLGQEIADELPERALNYLIVSYLRSYNPTILSVLKFFEVILVVEHNFTATHDAYDEIFIQWGTLGEIFTGPGELIKSIYHWNEPANPLDEGKFLDRLYEIAIGLGIPAEKDNLTVLPAEKLYYPDGTAEADIDRDFLLRKGLIRVPFMEVADPEFGFTTSGIYLLGIPIRDADPTVPKGLAIVPYLMGPAAVDFTISETLRLSVGGNLDAGFAITILPPEEVDVIEDLFGDFGFTADFFIRLIQQNPDGKFIILGQPEATYVGYDQLSLTLGLSGIGSQPDFGLEFDIANGTILIVASDGDGFLQYILPQDPSRVDFNITLGWSVRKGFYIRGGAGIEISIPINISLGPVFINTVDLGLYVNTDNIEFVVAVSGGVQIGPVQAVVKKIGIISRIEFGQQGNLGNADFSMGFKPPTAIGLAIVAEGVKGGGFLEVDPPNYAGILNLAFQDSIDVTAFGLLTTELPGGVPGFSLIASISARFSPIQLGFGFALIGVGGLIGINRSMQEEALREVVKNHGLDYILFPENPIGDAVLIIDAIQTVFPPQDSCHVFGLMGEIIWGGSVTVVDFQFGIVFETCVPRRVALLGQAKVELPNKDSPVLVLNFDMVGFIDFGNESLAIDGTLFNSRLLVYPLDGEMALRTNWGDNADFALSAGGFNPQFSPPPGFPSLKRLTMSLRKGPARITLDSYVAITSNTFQTGASLELYAEYDRVTVTGNAGFDALIRFSPFSFETSFFAWMTVEVFGENVACIDLLVNFTGPNPYRTEGYAKLKLSSFGPSVDIDFDKTFGDPVAETPPQVSPFEVLLAQLEDSRNLQFELPDWANSYIKLVEADYTEKLLDPVGAVVLSQNAVPLELQLERYGGGTPPSNEQYMSLDVDGETVQAPFSPAQFRNWSDTQKLQAQAFENFAAGKRLRSTFHTSPLRSVVRDFEVVLVERQAEPDLADPSVYEPIDRAPVIPIELRRSWALQGGRQRFQPGRTVRNPDHPKYIQVMEPAYTVTSQEATDSLFIRQPEVDGSAGDLSYTEALDKMNSSRDENAVVRGVEFATSMTA